MIFIVICFCIFDKDLDLCEPNPCVGGRCYDFGNGYQCRCFHGYEGKNCAGRPMCMITTELCNIQICNLLC